MGVTRGDLSDSVGILINIRRLTLRSQFCFDKTFIGGQDVTIVITSNKKPRTDHVALRWMKAEQNLTTFRSTRKRALSRHQYLLNVSLSAKCLKSVLIRKVKLCVNIALMLTVVTFLIHVCIDCP